MSESAWALAYLHLKPKSNYLIYESMSERFSKSQRTLNVLFNALASESTLGVHNCF
jgi:hypothetical protein